MSSMVKKWSFRYSRRRKSRRGTRNGGIRSKVERRKPVAESRPLPEITVDTLTWSPVKSILRKMNAAAEKQKLDVDDLSSEVQKRLMLKNKHLKKPEERFNETFVPLTEGEHRQVSNTFAKFNRQKILVKHQKSNIDITGQTLQCLKPGGWLNDEAISVYFGLLKEWEQREPKSV